MALSTIEGTKQKTMDIISSRLSLSAGTIKYARIFSRWVTRDNHPKGSFTATLDCYLEDAPSADQLAPLHHEFGCTLPDTAISQMATTDDREILYKHLEYIINFQDAQRRQETDPDFDPVAEEADLQALETELGITSLFHLQVPEPSPTE